MAQLQTVERNRRNRRHLWTWCGIIVVGLIAAVSLQGCSMFGKKDAPLPNPRAHCQGGGGAIGAAALGALKGLPGGGVLAGAASGALERGPIHDIDGVSDTVEACIENARNHMKQWHIPEEDIPADLRCYCWTLEVDRGCIRPVLKELYCAVPKSQGQEPHA